MIAEAAAGQTELSAWGSIVVGVGALFAAWVVAKGWGVRYEAWIVRTLFRVDPDSGWIGRHRNGRLYRFWQVGVGSAFLALVGVAFVVSGVARLVNG